MSVFRRNSEPQLPQEVNVPMPHITEQHDDAVTAWAPKRHHIMPAQDQAHEAIEKAVGVLNNYREQVSTLEARLHDLEVRKGILDGRISDLELTNAQLRNELTVSRTAEMDAKREASDWLSLWQNVAAMISSFEIGAAAPSAARRKANARVKEGLGAKNGEQAVVQPPAETLTTDATKPAEETP